MPIILLQVFLQSITAKKAEMQIRNRDLEWWMRRRQLPTKLRLRVRQQERHRWAATRGIDEEALVGDLPEGLRRDIKRHLCIDLLKKVPLFEQLDELILNNICDRLKPVLFSKGEPVSPSPVKLTLPEKCQTSKLPTILIWTCYILICLPLFSIVLVMKFWNVRYHPLPRTSQTLSFDRGGAWLKGIAPANWLP